MKTKYIVIKQHYEDIERVRVFSDFKHLREYIALTLERELEERLKIAQAIPQSKFYLAENDDRKKELVKWINAKSLADLTDPDEYFYTRAGEIYQCAENQDQTLQIGGVNDT